MRTSVMDGHDVTMTPVRVRADQLAAGDMLPATMVAASGVDLDRFEEEIRPGVASGERTPQAEILDRPVDDLVSLRQRQRQRHGLRSSLPASALPAARR